MRSSKSLFAAGVFAATFAALGAFASNAEAQQKAQGFAVERFYQSAPGGGWFVMDELDMHGEIGGALALSGGYAYKPLVVTDGSQHLGVVTHEAFADVGAAVTYDRFRLYLNVTTPLVISGDSGVVGNYQFTGPYVDAGKNPDLISDVRVGYDARLVGGPRSAFRLGIGAQLIIPNGNRVDYDTDDTFRAMIRLLFAGDIGMYKYAGHIGVHIRSVDDSPTPGSPEGSEILFGVAAGRQIKLRSNGKTVIVIGPEIYGETAAQAFGSNATGIEGILTGRIEGTGDDGTQLRVKVGGGGGIVPRFGAPEWRFVVGVEAFDHGSDRDKDGVPDSKDACPDAPGVKTSDPKTNGCPPDRDRDGVPDVEDACPDVPGIRSSDPKTNGCPASVEGALGNH